MGSVYNTNKHKRNQSLVRFIFRARHKHTHKRHHILKIDGEEAKKKSVDSLSRFVRKSSITRERRERERDERNKNEKNTKNNTCTSSSVYRRRKTYHDGLLCVCVFRGARSKRKRLRFSSYWSKEKFSFFCERETKRRKNIKNGSQKRKNSKILLFLRFFCSSLDRRPKHLQILGHLHAHRYSIHFFSLKISLCFVR